MNRILKRRPSPALIISVIGSLTGKDMGKNTLTGAQIRESKVGKVPKAKVADKVGNKTAAAVTTRAFFAAQKSPKSFTGNDTLIGKIALPAGAYIISAKLTATNTATGILRATCSLRAGNSVDEGTTSLPPGKDANSGVLPLLQAHFQSTPFEASVDDAQLLDF